MEVIEIPVDSLRPCPWNVNRMSAAIEHKLTEYIRREGLVEPIVVRPHPTETGRYQILGGFHRWKICKEKLGYESMPCVVVHLDDKRAKILSINLNEMTGEPVPALLSELLHDLNREIAVEDLETLLPYDSSAIEDALELLKLPEGLDRLLEEEAAKEEAEAPVILSLVLDKKQYAVVEAAIDHAIRTVGAIKNRKGRAVELMAAAYLREAGEAVPACAATDNGAAGRPEAPEGRRDA
jgi:ParB/RepB/Spo0J family partition protein